MHEAWLKQEKFDCIDGNAMGAGYTRFRCGVPSPLLFAQHELARVTQQCPREPASASSPLKDELERAKTACASFLLGVPSPPANSTTPLPFEGGPSALTDGGQGSGSDFGSSLLGGFIGGMVGVVLVAAMAKAWERARRGPEYTSVKINVPGAGAAAAQASSTTHGMDGDACDPYAFCCNPDSPVQRQMAGGGARTLTTSGSTASCASDASDVRSVQAEILNHTSRIHERIGHETPDEVEDHTL